MAGLPGASGNSSPGPVSILQGAGSAGILVSVSGAHLHTQAWEDETPTAMAAPHIPAELIEAKRLRAPADAGGARGMGSGVRAALAEHVLREAPPPAGAVVSGFWPMGQEIDIRPLLLALHERAIRSCCQRHRSAATH